MKRITFFLALCLLTFSSMAQRPTMTPEDRAKAMTTTMTQHLKLNANQATKVTEINLTSIKQLEQARQTHKNDPRQLKAVMDLISATRLEALKNVLSFTQFQQYQQQRERKLGIPAQAGTTGGAPQEYGN